MSFRPILSTAGKLYGFAANIRNALYERRIFRSTDLGCRTISIGNITAGGTGKTPLVSYVAELLTKNGERICILTRGYGRENSGDRVVVSDGKDVLVDAKRGGDEPVELANKLLGKAIIIADADRVSAAAWTREHFEITTFILDDGFQHRRVKRDLDIVLIDATNPFGGGMIPAGTLREPIANLGRADAVIVTRADLVESTKDIISKIRSINPDTQIFTAKNSIVKIRELVSGDSFQKIPETSFAFCGLGNPDNFFELLKQNGCEPLGKRSFRDHHFYTQKDMIELTAEARKLGAKCLVTTAKDAVKLSTLTPFELPVYVIEIEPVIVPTEEFRSLIAGTL